MSSQITTAQVEQYSANVALLVQQQGSNLRRYVREESILGKAKYFEQIGTTDAVLRTVRHGDSPLIDVPHLRRKVEPVDYEWGALIDDLDQVKMLINPKSDYAVSAAYAMGRSIDDVIIAAATGTAYTGVAGGTSTTLPATQKVAVNLSGSNEGLTIDKLIAARSLFGQNDVDINDPMNKLYFALSQKQMDDLLKTTEFGSKDYNPIQALHRGEINSYMGFDFVRTERLALNTSTDVRTCFAWAKSGILLGMNSEVKGRIAERADKSFATYVYASMAIGATRMEEEKVVQVLCDQSP